MAAKPNAIRFSRPFRAVKVSLRHQRYEKAAAENTSDASLFQKNGFGDYEEVWDRNPSLPPLHDRYIGRNEKSAAEILAPAALVKPVNPSHQRAPFGYDPLWVYKKFTRFQEPQYNRFNNDI